MRVTAVLSQASSSDGRTERGRILETALANNQGELVIPASLPDILKAQVSNLTSATGANEAKRAGTQSE